MTLADVIVQPTGQFLRLKDMEQGDYFRPAASRPWQTAVGVCRLLEALPDGHVRVAFTANPYYGVTQTFSLCGNAIREQVCVTLHGRHWVRRRHTC